MKYAIKLLIILLIAACSAQKISKSTSVAKKKVFLFAGQSNMDGRANGAEISDADLERLSKVADRIEFYYNHQDVTPLKLTTPSKYIQKKFNLAESFGPELFFGIEMAENNPADKFVFVKRAKGGTSLYGCWNPEWSEDKANLMNELDQSKLYADFINYTKEVLSQYSSSEYEVKGMLWVQGETDSAVKKWGKKPAETYGKNLRKLITATRTDIGVNDLPFVAFQVGSGEVVAGMELTVENDVNAYLIPQSNNKDSEDFYVKKPPPIGHYTAASMKKIGIRFAEVFKTIEAKE